MTDNLSVMDTSQKPECSNWTVSKIIKWLRNNSLTGKERVFVINDIGK